MFFKTIYKYEKYQKFYLKTFVNFYKLKLQIFQLIIEQISLNMFPI